MGTSNPVVQLAALETDLSGVYNQLVAIASVITQQEGAAYDSQAILVAQVETVQAQLAASTASAAELLTQIQALTPPETT